MISTDFGHLLFVLIELTLLTGQATRELPCGGAGSGKVSPSPVEVTIGLPCSAAMDMERKNTPLPPGRRPDKSYKYPLDSPYTYRVYYL